MEGFDLLLDVEGVRRAIGWVGGRRRGRRREMDGFRALGLSRGGEMVEEEEFSQIGRAHV